MEVAVGRIFRVNLTHHPRSLHAYVRTFSPFPTAPKKRAGRLDFRRTNANCAPRSLHPERPRKLGTQILPPSADTIMSISVRIKSNTSFYNRHGHLSSLLCHPLGLELLKHYDKLKKNGFDRELETNLVGDLAEGLDPSEARTLVSLPRWSK